MTASLAPDRRIASDVGRRARLELVFACRRGRTVLAHAYAEPPFRVGRCFVEGDGLHMIMVSSAPGIFGGDDFEQTVHVEAGAHVRLTSQSALQVHPAAGRGGARMASTYDVASGGSLHCHWDPLIPFARSQFEQRIDIRVAGDARLFWSDAFMSGRAGGALASVLPRRQEGGERWEFEALAYELRITRDSRLEFLERYRIEPEARPATPAWIAGDASYFGTTIVSGRRLESATVESMHGNLNGIPGLHAAVDQLDPGLVVARLAASSGVAFHSARHALGVMVRDLVSDNSDNA